ncbi:hypothetical protein [Pseudoalteromonas sp. UG3-2]
MQSEITRICQFLSEIGLPFKLCALSNGSFLPGLETHNGVLHIDVESLKYPGDILHEAGHIAVCEPAFRPYLNADVYRNGLLLGREKQAMHGEEIAATAWSVAASKKIGLPLEVVMHEHAYRGGSQSIIDIFQQGGLFGQPLLSAWQMTCPERGFPHMLRWIRELRWVEELPDNEGTVSKNCR